MFYCFIVSPPFSIDPLPFLFCLLEILLIFGLWFLLFASPPEMPREDFEFHGPNWQLSGRQGEIQ
jgi:hypothetical protein